MRSSQGPNVREHDCATRWNCIQSGSWVVFTGGHGPCNARMQPLSVFPDRECSAAPSVRQGLVHGIALPWPWGWRVPLQAGA